MGILAIIRSRFKKGEEMVSLEIKVSVKRINGVFIPKESNPQLYLRTIPAEPALTELEFNGQKIALSKDELLKAVKALMG